MAVVQWAGVSGVPEIPVAGSKPDAFDEAAARDQILSALRDQLARYKQPRRVVFVPALPRNAMGKVQKKLLREQYADSFAVPNSP